MEPTTIDHQWNSMTRSVQCRNDPEASKMRTGIPILCQMGRISDHRSLVGTRGILFEWRWHSWSVQTTSPTMNLLTSETASPLSLTDDMEELDWFFQDIFDQFGNVYCLFDDINRLLDDCPLEFLLFEVQQLISFLRWHWNASHPCLWTMILRPLPYCLFFQNLRPSHARKPTNLPCSIPSTRTTRLLSPLLTLLDYLLHHFFFRTNSSRVTWQSGSCFRRIRYYWHCQSTPTLPRSDLPTNARSCFHCHHYQHWLHPISTCPSAK